MKLTAFGHDIFLAPLVDHLWQSTIVAVIALLAVLALRRNRASLRYWIWFAASMKFLLPFALLINAGQALRPAKATAPVQVLALTEAIDQITQPFSQPLLNPPTAPAHISEFRELLPYGLAALWLVGALLAAFRWWHKRRRIVQTLRTATSSNVAAEIPVLCAKSALEPGIFGIFRPVLLLPEGIAERLTAAQLQAIIAHEICHVRRRDNLTYGLHMLVECLFWFHPLVWWIGERLVDERERACDEHVLSLGADPQVYAESILRVCNFYLESPLFCAAGVTGSNLKKRIEAIMINRNALHLGFGKKLLLTTAAIFALSGPIVFGLLRPLPSEAKGQTQKASSAVFAFSQASILPNTAGTVMDGFSIKRRPGQDFSAMMFKPDRFMANNVTLFQLIHTAYQVQDDQIVGAADWINSEKYDIDARIDAATLEKLNQLEPDQSAAERRVLLQALLADRFKVATHRETKVLSAYVLTVADTGSKLQSAKPGDTYANGAKGLGNAPAGPGQWGSEPGKELFQGMPVSSLVLFLANRLHRLVVDQTGLTAKYDFTLQWTPLTPESSSPSIVSAVHDQLGLQLTKQDVPVEVLVIDRAERPAQQ